MTSKNLIGLIFCLSLFMVSCTLQDESLSLTELETIESDSDARQFAGQRSGATQISGIGFYAGTECDAAGEGADFALYLTGDFVGCLYVFVDDYECSPSGTYRETGREYFIGTYNDETGSFWTNYKFESKFEGCDESGAFLGAEIFGRCQHPIENDSGEGVFEGVTGRIDFKDNVVTHEFPYRGHLRY